MLRLASAERLAVDESLYSLEYSIIYLRISIVESSASLRRSVVELTMECVVSDVRR